MNKKPWKQARIDAHIKPLLEMAEKFRQKTSAGDQFIYREINKTINQVKTASPKDVNEIINSNLLPLFSEQPSSENSDEIITALGEPSFSPSYKYAINKTNEYRKEALTKQQKFNIARGIILRVLLIVTLPAGPLATILIGLVLCKAISKLVTKEETIHEKRLSALEKGQEGDVELQPINKTKSGEQTTDQEDIDSSSAAPQP